MPLYETECEKCGNEKEVLTLKCSEPLPVCDKCGGKLKKNMPSHFSWRWLYGEGVWETNTEGRQVFKGKGGKKVTLGGEQLDVHEGLPVQHEERSSGKVDSDDGPTFDEVDPSTIPKGVAH